MSTTTHPTTAAELLVYSARNHRCELIRGELREMSPAGSEHGEIAANLAGNLIPFVKKHRLGRVRIAEAGFLLEKNPDTVRAPDVAFVRSERVAAVGKTPGYWQGPPDLAVEVMSPNDNYTEVDEKVSQWLTAGCRMVIVVNPRSRTATVHLPGGEIIRLTEADSLDGRDVVPGWRMPLREVFE